MSDVTEPASGPITSSGDGITAQLIHPIDRTGLIMIVSPAVVSKFFLEDGVNYSYSVAAHNTRQERRG